MSDILSDEQLANVMEASARNNEVCRLREECERLLTENRMLYEALARVQGRCTELLLEARERAKERWEPVVCEPGPRAIQVGDLVQRIGGTDGSRGRVVGRGADEGYVIVYWADGVTGPIRTSELCYTKEMPAVHGSAGPSGVHMGLEDCPITNKRDGFGSALAECRCAQLLAAMVSTA